MSCTRSDVIGAPSKVAVLGLGKMGVAIANNLAKAGFVVFGWTRSGQRPGKLSGPVKMVEKASAAVEDATAVVMMLFDDKAVEQVLFESGLVRHLVQQSLVIDMGTSGPEAAKTHAKRLAEYNCDYLDAPVSGGTTGAETASLTLFVGGTKPNYDRARLLLQTLGAPHHLGEVGAGQSAKLANQIIVAVTIAAVAEGLNFAEREGLQSLAFLSALEGGFADSRVLRTHGPRMAKRDFSAGGAIQLHLKDLLLASQSAPKSFDRLKHANLAADTFQALADRNAALLDHSAYVLTYLK
ncbi:NAD(P)-dependent oxidoreductase [Pseudomonas abietaniphila]